MAIKLTIAAQENVDETGCDVDADVAALLSGKHTIASLLAYCLDGADADRRDGWRDYVTAIVEHVTDSVTRAQIKALRAEALTAGDEAQAAICDRALAGDDGGDAWIRCAGAIAEARAHQ